MTYHFNVSLGCFWSPRNMPLNQEEIPPWERFQNLSRKWLVMEPRHSTTTFSLERGPSVTQSRRLTGTERPPWRKAPELGEDLGGSQASRFKSKCPQKPHTRWQPNLHSEYFSPVLKSHQLIMPNDFALVIYFVTFLILPSPLKAKFQKPTFAPHGKSPRWLEKLLQPLLQSMAWPAIHARPYLASWKHFLFYFI